jgi:predicted transcriptional regulator
MTIAEAAAILNCKTVCGADKMDRPLSSACGADLMSDVLAFVKEDCLLLTGMVNAHVVRTAEMLDVPCIVLVRGKVPSQDMIELAEQTGVTLLTCEYTLYEACGRLYQNGLPPCSK